MKQHARFSIYVLIFFLSSIVHAQQLSSCVNADFELGDFTNWIGKTGSCCPIFVSNTGIVSGQHTIMSGTGFDPHSNNQIPVVAPGGTYSARLGNDNVGSEAEQLIYSFTVTPQTLLFIYRYAVVLEDPVHDPTDQPRFQIRVFDQNNNPVGCGTYNVVSGTGIPGFQTWFDPITGDDIHFQTWQTVGIELSAYMGQTVTIEFSTGDCALGGHFGYAYVDAYCSPLVVSSDYCPGASFATLIAPPGFASYLWSNGATTPTITINNPTVGAQYSVTMTSVTGCTITLTQVITVTNLVANFYVNPACENGARFFDSSYAVTGSSINQWLWNFGDGTTSVLQNPAHQFPALGTYNVTLTATNQGGCVKSVTKSIVVQPAPTANFTFVPDCPKQPIAFTNTSSFPAGSITSYSWTFGDGATFNGLNTPHTYPGTGPYNATLIITGNNGCTDTVTKVVAPKPKPAAAFNFSVQCLSNSVAFTDVSTLTGGNVVAWQWNFGDGSPFSNLQNPIHNYSAGGSYTVTLFVTGSNGCTDTISKGVSMTTFPTAAFSNAIGCEKHFTKFTDNSTLTGGAISSWFWYFGDGTTSTLQNPNHVYAADNNYTVSLVVLGNNGCSDSTAKNIAVLPAPVADFAATQVCPGQSANFTGNSTFSSGALVTWNWAFGDGTATASGINTTHTFAAAGTYAVTYAVTGNNGCADTIIKNVSTSVTPTARFAAPGGCQNEALLFSSSSVITSGSIIGWQWDFGDGSPNGTTASLSHAYTQAGSFNVFLTVTSNNGCTNTVLHEVSVSAKPVPNFTVSSLCEQDSTHFINTSTSVNGVINYTKWAFGDGTTLTGQDDTYHVYADSGWRNLTLIVGNSIGCRDTLNRTIYIKAKPDIGFKWDDICEQAPAQFYDTSSLVNGAIVAWMWNFSSGSASGLQPQHVFASAGQIPVSLNVTGSNGCKSSLTKTVIVHPKPVPAFSVPTGCVNAVRTFQNTSSIPNGNIVSWNWSYGDGHTGTSFAGANTYATDGYFPVTLIATSDFGCLDTLVDTVRIYPLPVANFSAPSVCLNQTSVFNDLSQPVSDSLILWQWNFGDGSPVATQQNPVHTYAADGTYLATLTVYNEGMCSKSYTRTVVVRPLPHVGFYNSNPCVYSSVQFTDTSFLAGYNILSWSWNFGDSTTATTATPQHNYNQFGIFNVTLTATASNACSNSMVQPITVNRLPLAQFAASNICEGNPVNVVNQSVLVNGNIATSVWNWGDGSTDSTFNPSHIYAVDGNYTIQLQVSGSNGCLKDTTALITIYDKPVAAFTHSNLCQQAPVQFTDGSTVQNDTLAAWAWNFNDGTLENQPSLVHTFSTYQTYNVQLIVTSGFGCSDTIIKPITIAPKPVANFSSEDVCFKEPMIFTDNSLVAVGNIQTWTWNFGDSFTSSLINPQHLYATTGNQNITLIVKTFNNCYDTISKQYKVYELPVADFIADTAEGCQPLWINYVNTSVPNEGMLVKWNWDFGDATTDTVAQPDAHLYDVPGYYDIFLQVETSLGCRDTLLNRNFIHVFPKPEAAFITEPSTTTILHAIIDIKDQSWGAVEWLYDFNDSTFSAERNPTHQFPMPAQYFVTQVVTSVDGCRDTTFRYVDVQNDFALYFPNSFTPNGDGKNESWKAEGIGIAEFNLQLFNRWGQTIFVSNSMEKGWDGSYQKQVVQQGVYIYKATVRDIFNKQHSYIGSVTVLR